MRTAFAEIYVQTIGNMWQKNAARDQQLTCCWQSGNRKRLWQRNKCEKVYYKVDNNKDCIFQCVIVSCDNMAKNKIMWQRGKIIRQLCCFAWGEEFFGLSIAFTSFLTTKEVPFLSINQKRKKKMHSIDKT